MHKVAIKVWSPYVYLTFLHIWKRYTANQVDVDDEKLTLAD